MRNPFLRKIPKKWTFVRFVIEPANGTSVFDSMTKPQPGRRRANEEPYDRSNRSSRQSRNWRVASEGNGVYATWDDAITRLRAGVKTIKDAAMSTYKVIGTRPIRHDGVDKVTGRALYGADIQ